MKLYAGIGDATTERRRKEERCNIFIRKIRYKFQETLSDADVIRLAFLEAIDILGARGSRALVEDLERYGVFLYDKNLSLENIARGLREMLGEGTTQLLLEDVYIMLDKLHSSRMQV